MSLSVSGKLGLCLKFGQCVTKILWQIYDFSGVLSQKRGKRLLTLCERERKRERERERERESVCLHVCMCVCQGVLVIKRKRG